MAGLGETSTGPFGVLKRLRIAFAPRRAERDQGFVSSLSTASLALLVLSFPFAAYLIASRATDCGVAPYLIGFAGNEEAYVLGLERFRCDDAPWDSASQYARLSYAAIALWLATAGLLLRRVWRDLWISRPMRDFAWIAWAGPMGAACFAIAALLVPRSYEDGVDGVQIGIAAGDGRGPFNDVGHWIATAAWAGSAAGGIVLLLLAGGAIGRISHGPMPTIPQDRDRQYRTAAHGVIGKSDAAGGLGICVSGGGIRAGSVAAGALWHLDSHEATDGPTERVLQSSGQRSMRAYLYESEILELCVRAIVQLSTNNDTRGVLFDDLLKLLHRIESDALNQASSRSAPGTFEYQKIDTEIANYGQMSDLHNKSPVVVRARDLGNIDQLLRQYHTAQFRLGLTLRAKHGTRPDTWLESATYLASVSGGGYTAGSWTIAKGTYGRRRDRFTAKRWDDGAFGTYIPLDDEEIQRPELEVNFDDAGTSSEDEDNSIGFSLRRHILARREFLTTGRGGVAWSSLLVLAGLAIQLAIIAAAVFIAAWPTGRFSNSWPVTGTNAPIGSASGPEATTLTLRNTFAPIVILGISALLLVLSLPFWNTRRRRNLQRLSAGSAGLAGVLLILMTVVPALVDQSISSEIWTFVVAALAVLSGVLGTFMARAAGSLGLSAVRFSGALVAVPILALFLFIAQASAIDKGRNNRQQEQPLSEIYGGLPAGLIDLIPSPLISIGWLDYVSILGLFLIAWITLDPRLWSLSNLYRHRLRGAFAVTDRRDHAEFNHPWARKHQVPKWNGPIGKVLGYLDLPFGRRWANSGEPAESVLPVGSRYEAQLNDYDRERPVPLVCASASRRDVTGTGVSALSFVFTPESVYLYDIDRPENADRSRTYTYSGRTVDFLASLGKPRENTDKSNIRARKRERPARLVNPWAGSRRRQSLGTMSAALAVSGAAASPAMGRKSVGSLGALLAATNVRLGVWYPNPLHLQRQWKPSWKFILFGKGDTGELRVTRIRRPGLGYMFKEVLGVFDPEDRHIYVTDGGHRENLGLVELLRRQCTTIICIDASGDAPGSFGALMEAAELARAECGARLQIDSAQLDRLRVGPDQQFAERCSITIPVLYEGTGSKGVVHYAKAVVDGSDRALAAYASEDRKFPNYSTGDQFLSETQVRMLMRLGQRMSQSVLEDLRSRQHGTTSKDPTGGSQIGSQGVHGEGSGDL